MAMANTEAGYVTCSEIKQRQAQALDQLDSCLATKIRIVCSATMVLAVVLAVGEHRDA